MDKSKTAIFAYYPLTSILASPLGRPCATISKTIAASCAARTSAPTAREGDFDEGVCEGVHTIDYEPAGANLGLGSGSPDHVEHTRCANARLLSRIKTH